MRRQLNTMRHLLSTNQSPRPFSGHPGPRMANQAQHCLPLALIYLATHTFVANSSHLFLPCVRPVLRYTRRHKELREAQAVEEKASKNSAGAAAVPVSATPPSSKKAEKSPPAASAAGAAHVAPASTPLATCSRVVVCTVTSVEVYDNIAFGGKSGRRAKVCRDKCCARVSFQMKRFFFAFLPTTQHLPIVFSTQPHAALCRTLP